MKEYEHEKAELIMQKAYMLDDIIHLPHYQDGTKFVSPGFAMTHNKTVSARELIEAGAVAENIPLWGRG